jgi:hypothetical protein
MERCEEDLLVVACGLHLSEEERERRKYWIYNVFREREEEAEFHTLFGRLKDDRQKIFKFLE